MSGSSWKAKRYLDRTGETIAQACARLHAAGAKIAHAAAEVGYCNSNELRKYFERTGQECPWPKRKVKRGNWGDHRPLHPAQAPR